MGKWEPVVSRHGRRGAGPVPGSRPSHAPGSSVLFFGYHEYIPVLLSAKAFGIPIRASKFP